MLPWAVRGCHLHDPDPEADALLLFQPHSSLRAHLLHGAIGLHIATGFRREAHFRYWSLLCVALCVCTPVLCGCRLTTLAMLDHSHSAVSWCYMATVQTAFTRIIGNDKAVLTQSHIRHTLLRLNTLYSTQKRHKNTKYSVTRLSALTRLIFYISATRWSWTGTNTFKIRNLNFRCHHTSFIDCISQPSSWKDTNHLRCSSVDRYARPPGSIVCLNALCPLLDCLLILGGPSP